MIDYIVILSTKYKGSYWSLNGDSYEGLTWLSDSPKPTKEELDAQWDEVLSIKQKQDCKTTAKTLLAASDWSELPSSIELLENASEWKAYRIAIKQLLISPVQSPVWPTAPEVRWKN